MRGPQRPLSCTVTVWVIQKERGRESEREREKGEGERWMDDGWMDGWMDVLKKNQIRSVNVRLHVINVRVVDLY